MFGPTAHTAKPAAAPEIGRFALPCGPHRAPGSGASSRGLAATAAPFMVRSLMAVCALVVLLAFSTGVARAEVPRLVPNGTFATEGGLGVAVDQSSGDVFVAGFEGQGAEAHIEEFEASGKLLKPPSPFGEGFREGAAVNPTNGDLYVLSAFSNQIEAYDPNTGGLISSFPVAPFWAGFHEIFEALTQIATDSAGNMYMPNFPGHEVLEYSETGALLKTFTGSGAHALSGPTGVAVAPSGDVWVADYRGNRIEEFAPDGEPVEVDGKPVEIKSEGVRAIALYEHEGAVDVLAVVYNNADPCGSVEPPCGHLVEYSSSGVQLADVGAGDFGASAAGGHRTAWWRWTRRAGACM